MRSSYGNHQATCFFMKMETQPASETSILMLNDGQLHRKKIVPVNHTQPSKSYCAELIQTRHADMQHKSKLKRRL
jgi:hypothetical protein